MSSAAWWLLGALVVLRLLYPRILEWRHARRFPMRSDGVIEGADSIDLPRDDAPAVLVLHGGGDTPQSMRGVADYLHGRGYAVRAPLLANHGRSLQRVSDFDADTWRAQVSVEIETLRARHDWVAVVGQSLGGALALDLAASHKEVRALVLLAPWVTMPDPIRMVARTSRVWEILLPYLPSLGGHSIHDPVARSRALTHGIVTPAELRALARMADVANEALSGARAPTLTIQSRGDERIAPDAAQRAFDRLAASDKRFEWVTDTGHVISVDYGKERVFELTADWLDRHRSP